MTIFELPFFENDQKRMVIPASYSFYMNDRYKNLDHISCLNPSM